MNKESLSEIDVEKLRKALGDERSKVIFENLYQFYNTKNYRFLEHAISQSGLTPNPIYSFYQSLKEKSEKGRKLVLYGLGQNIEDLYTQQEKYKGSMGYVFYPFIDDIKWNCFADKKYKKFQRGFHGQPVIGVEELTKHYKDAIIVVGTTDYYEEIRCELLSNGFDESNIIKYEFGTYVSIEERQYFEMEVMPPKMEKTYIDGGSYNGDTITKFVEWNRDFGYERIIGFEPGKVNFNNCITQTEQFLNTLIVNEGLSDSKGEISFYEDSVSGAASYINSKGMQTIQVTNIDTYLKDGPISFIKLDIEGFELEALKGARKVIETYRPRLAVCVYHKEMDLMQCAQLLLQYYPDYQLYVRMYTNTYCETVLYAIGN